MIDQKTYAWLMDQADAPIRYRVARELLKDQQAARGLEAELLNHPAVSLWLANLKPKSPPQHHSMEHGSFDFCLENALLKCAQLGLHAGISPVADAVSYYIEKIESTPMGDPLREGNLRTGFDSLLTINMLSHIGIENETLQRAMRKSLNELYRFMREGDYDIFCSEEERAHIKGIPKIWRDRRVIKRDLHNEFGFCYPLIYDLVGLYRLYDLNDTESTGKVDTIIEGISTDAFHGAFSEGYGVISPGNTRSYAMAWEPDYPGWHDLNRYFERESVPRLLFFAQTVAKYPSARRTPWFNRLLAHLEAYRTDSGTYLFPAAWLKESQGYAVLGNHLAFGENRRKKTWCEVESTFYMMSLLSHFPKGPIVS